MKVIQIGSGGWGKGWLEFIDKAEDVELVALINHRPGSLEEAAKKFAIPQERCFTDSAEGLGTDADLAIITIPHKWHLEYARKALEAGKNVLIEKPLSDSYEKVEEFLRYITEHRFTQKVWVSQNYRFREYFWAIKERIGKPEFGRISWMNVLFRMDSNTAGAWIREGWRKAHWSTLVEEITIHHFDVMRMLSGSEARSVACRAYNSSWFDKPGAECISAFIEFENGAVADYAGTLDAVGYITDWQGEWLVQTDKGSFRLQGERCVFETADHTVSETALEGFFPGYDRAGVLKEIGKALAGGPCQVPTIQDNVMSYALVWAAQVSAREGRKVNLDELRPRPRESGSKMS